MPTDQSTNSPIAEDLAQLRVAMSLECIRCGYDLFGLDANSDCPECSKPVRLTIFDTIDPISKRLEPLQHPAFVGNMIGITVTCCAVAGLFAIIASFIFPPQFIQLPVRVQTQDYMFLFFLSSIFGVFGMISVFLLLKHLCKSQELQSCRTGMILAVGGFLGWSISMMLFVGTLRFPRHSPPETSLFFHTLFPVLSAALVFLGFRIIIPQIGRRSRAFRQAQANRQRMNDMVGALGVVVVGRYLMGTSAEDTVLYTFGGILEVMSIALILVGLGYLVWNTLWIRNSLVTPPPSLQELLLPMNPE